MGCSSEVGLDYHYPNLTDRDREQQQKVLRDVVPLAAEAGLPVVVHCRGSGDDRASTECMHILHLHLPCLAKIHRHCYSGDSDEARDWTTRFSNICFGFTPTLLRSQRHEHLDYLVRVLDSGRIHLETDAPYLALPGGRPEQGHTWLLPVVTSKIADLKGVDVDLIWRASTECARRVYGLPRP